MKFERQIAKVLAARKPGTNMLNVLDALGYDQDRFQEAFDIALEMDNRDLVKLLYSNYQTRQIVVEFTLLANMASQKPA